MTKGLVDRIYLKYKRVLRRIAISSSAIQPSKLSREAQNLLMEMKRNCESVSSPFAAAEGWINNQKHYEYSFQREGLENVETSDFNLGYAGFAPTDPRLHYFLLYQLYSRIKPIDKFGLLKIVPAHVPAIKGNILWDYPGLGIEIDGNILSTDILLSISTVYSMYEADPRILTDSVVVADLGAGWGRIGYVLKRANPKASYHFFDLPHALLVANTYLPKILPNEKISDYRTGAKKEHISREYLLQYGLGFWDAQKLEKLEDGALDYFVNSASFGEMLRQQVKEYLGIVDKKLKGICYLFQLRDGQTHGHPKSLISGLSEYDFPSSWEELFIRDSILSNTYFESCHRVGAQMARPRND